MGIQQSLQLEGDFSSPIFKTKSKAQQKDAGLVKESSEEKKRRKAEDFDYINIVWIQIFDSKIIQIKIPNESFTCGDLLKKVNE